MSSLFHRAPLPYKKQLGCGVLGQELEGGGGVGVGPHPICPQLEGLWWGAAVGQDSRGKR